MGNIEKQIRAIKSKFPFDYNGIILNLLNDNIEINEKPCGVREYLLDVIDNEGYKYHIKYNYLKNTKRQKTLNRFFRHNPYTRDNIENFMKIHNIKDLNILDDVSEHTAKTLMNVEIKGETYKISWNTISNKFYKFSSENIDNYINNVKAKNMTKEEVSKIILKMYKRKGMALFQNDFDGRTTSNHIGTKLVEKYFGTIVNMQKELNLPVPSEYKILNNDELFLDIKKICEMVYKNENRRIITTKDIEKYGAYSCSITYNERLNKLGLSVKDYIESLGYTYQSSGNGMNHTFEDGEKVVSRYEYEFSNFLRDNGFEYNKTYFRDVLYRQIDKEYTGNMNCDYCIDFNGQLVYIELAGILCHKEHQEAYRNNIPLKSKSKEEYRLKLNQKREMFERNNLEYYILLPDEMNEEIYKNILKKYLKEAA